MADILIDFDPLNESGEPNGTAAPSAQSQTTPQTESAESQTNTMNSDIKINPGRVREDINYSPQFGPDQSQIRFNKMLQDLNELTLRENDRSEEMMQEYAKALSTYVKLVNMMLPHLNRDWDEVAGPDEQGSARIVVSISPKLLKTADELQNIFDAWICSNYLPPTHIIQMQSGWMAENIDKIDNLQCLTRNLLSSRWCSSTIKPVVPPLSKKSLMDLNFTTEDSKGASEGLREGIEVSTPTEKMVSKYGRDATKKRYETDPGIKTNNEVTSYAMTTPSQPSTLNPKPPQPKPRTLFRNKMEPNSSSKSNKSLSEQLWSEINWSGEAKKLPSPLLPLPDANVKETETTSKTNTASTNIGNNDRSKSCMWNEDLINPLPDANVKKTETTSKTSITSTNISNNNQSKSCLWTEELIKQIQMFASQGNHKEDSPADKGSSQSDNGNVDTHLESKNPPADVCDVQSIAKAVIEALNSSTQFRSNDAEQPTMKVNVPEKTQNENSVNQGNQMNQTLCPLMSTPITMEPINLPVFDGDIDEFEGWRDYIVTVLEEMNVSLSIRTKYIWRKLSNGVQSRLQHVSLNGANSYNTLMGELETMFNRKELLRTHCANKLLAMSNWKEASTIVQVRALYDYVYEYSSKLRRVTGNPREGDSYHMLIYRLCPNHVKNILENMTESDTIDGILEAIKEHLRREENKANKSGINPYKATTGKQVNNLMLSPVNDIGRQRDAEIQLGRSNDDEYFTCQIETRPPPHAVHQHSGNKFKPKQSDRRFKQSVNQAPTKEFSLASIATPLTVNISKLPISDYKTPENCVFCSKAHSPHKCDKYNQTGKFWDEVYKSKLCRNCLANDHDVTICPFDSFCPCDQGDAPKHSLLLHNHSRGARVIVTSAVMSNNKVGEGSPRLQTIKMKVRKPGSKSWRPARGFLDSGSMANLAPNALADELELKVLAEERINFKTWANKKREMLGRWVQMEISPVEGGRVRRISVIAVPQGNGIMRGRLLSEAQEKFLNDNQLPIADPEAVTDVDMPIDILLGINSYYNIIYEAPIRLPGGMVAIKSDFGYILSGGWSKREMSMPDTQLSFNFIETSRFHVTDEDEEETFKQFTSLDCCEDEEEVSPVLKEFKDKVNIREGRIEGPFPWINRRKKHLKTHLNECFKRCNSSYRRRSRSGNEDLKRKVTDYLKEQIEANVVIKVADLGNVDEVAYNLEKNKEYYDQLPNDNINQKHYFPSQEVYKPSSFPPKLRMVYDASVKEHKHEWSMNDSLEKGPPLTNHIVKSSLEFRKARVAIISDIEKAFLNVLVSLTDSDMLRFLWRNDDRIEVYKFLRLPFGLTCSPFILAASLITIINRSEISEDLKQKMISVLYVDDATASFDDEEEALEFILKMKEVLAAVGMPLKKFNSNDAWVREEFAKIEGEERPKEEKVLGMTWRVEEDTIGVNSTRILKRLDGDRTKTDIYSVMAQLYDPLHMLAPFVFRAKEILREACEKKLAWKKPLTKELDAKWKAWKEELRMLESISIPRRLLVREALKCHLVGFSDASGRGYAAVIYVISQNDRETDSNLVICKTKLKPVVEQSIPRMELMAAVLLSKLMKIVMTWLSSWNLQEPDYYIDSKAALYWIKADHLSQPPFVSNRIKTINMLSDRMKWKYIPSKYNPADIPTRGTPLAKLADNALWWKGPSMLVNGEDIEEGLEPEEIPEECTVQCMQVNLVETEQVSGIGEIIQPSLTRSYHHLMRVTQLVHKAVNMLVKKENEVTIERTEAERLWFHYIQAKHYAQELDYCSKPTNERPKKVPPRVKWLRLYYDHEDELLKLDTRIVNRALDVPPILLPYDSDFTRMYVMAQHIRLGHAGVRAVLTDVRSQIWIPRARKLVTSAVNNCRVCRMVTARPFRLPMSPPLPEYRVRMNRPFEVIGLDYAGPMILKRGGKAYALIITCTASRATHIQATRSLSKKDFIYAFTKFMSRRGIPSLIISDNAKTFKSTANQLKDLCDLPEIKEYLNQRRVKWRFYTDRSPWKGGFIERIVSLYKAVLKKVMARAKINFEDFDVLTHEAEMIINSRPLTYVYDSAEEGEAITPSKLISGFNLTDLPPFKEVNWRLPTKSLETRLKTLNEIRLQLWKCWQKEYLAELTERHLRVNPVGETRVPKENEIVMIKGDNMTPRMKWKLGRIMKVYEDGRDGRIRSIKIQPVERQQPPVNKKQIDLTEPLLRSVNCAIPLEGDSPYYVHVNCIVSLEGDLPYIKH